MNSTDDPDQIRSGVVQNSTNAMQSIIQPSLPNSNTHPSYKVLVKSPKNSDDKDNGEINPQSDTTVMTSNVDTSVTTSTSLTTTSRTPASTSLSIDNSTTTHQALVKISSEECEQPEKFVKVIRKKNCPLCLLELLKKEMTPCEKNIATKEVAKIVQEKPEMFCAHIKEALNKKVKEDSSTFKSSCKEGCGDHGSANLSKETKRCDCPHCEVFETSGGPVSGKFNKTRDRLRRRLNEKRKKALKENKQQNSKPTELVIETQSAVSVNQQDIEDIALLVNYIEGTGKASKNSNSEKKAAKKARRKERKLEEERLKEEERLREEERIREEERLKEQQRKEEERLLEERRKKDAIELLNKSRKSKNNKKKTVLKTNEKNPAINKSSTNQSTKSGPMVTIKRVMESSNAEPTVTITLKGSTPDKDKLLYTLINGQSDLGTKGVDLSNISNELTKKQKKKIKKEIQAQTLIIPEIPLTKKERKKKRQEAKKIEEQNKVKLNKIEVKEPVSSTIDSDNTLNLQMLRLPPGITITKVDGPAVTRKMQTVPKVNPVLNQSTPIIQSSENRSGVIVVDTVKLKQDLPSSEAAVVTSKKCKKKKKNKTKTVGSAGMMAAAGVAVHPVSGKKSGDQFYYKLQESLGNKMGKNKLNESTNESTSSKFQQACIIKGANGMVTIRSPRLNGVNTSLNEHMDNLMPLHSVSPLMSELKPVISQNTVTYKPVTEMKKPFNAQEILSGLPGIEITKINKNYSKNKNDCKKGFQPADVSIIPTNIANGTSGDSYKLFYDNSDWSLESVFAPKDIKEDEVLDADELELEAFKRFCQQSVPPERKEKVAHLNVKDIILKKKSSGSVN